MNIQWIGIAVVLAVIVALGWYYQNPDAQDAVSDFFHEHWLAIAIVIIAAILIYGMLF